MGSQWAGILRGVPQAIFITPPSMIARDLLHTSPTLLICLMVYREKKSPVRGLLIDCLAEAVRFELTGPFEQPDFKTGAIDHSATLPADGIVTSF